MCALSRCTRANAAKHFEPTRGKEPSFRSGPVSEFTALIDTYTKRMIRKRLGIGVKRQHFFCVSFVLRALMARPCSHLGTKPRLRAVTAVSGYRILESRLASTDVGRAKDRAGVFYDVCAITIIYAPRDKPPVRFAVVSCTAADCLPVRGSWSMIGHPPCF